jgi:hypothetical protein
MTYLEILKNDIELAGRKVYIYNPDLPSGNAFMDII